MAKEHFDVSPRYSPGSPAMVSEAIARRVALEEKEDYERTLEGIYGAVAAAEAKLKGLAGIALRMVETGRAWKVEDLITGKKWLFPFEGKCSKCKAKHTLRRGTLPQHDRHLGQYVGACEGSGQFLGKQLEDFETF